MPTESGYSNQKMRGPARHKTLQTMGSDRVGIPTAQMYLYEKTPVAIEVITVTKLDAKRIQLEFDNPHGAKKFDILRMLDGALEAWEFEIIQVVDATNIVVYNIGDIEGVEELPAVGDTVKTLRWVTAKSDENGALTTSSGPIEFIRDAATTVVNEDTATPALNRPLPAGMYILKDGVAYPVEDSATPADVVAVPVKIMAVDGTNINITAGDLHVQLSDLGANFDATRIGDGSGVYLKVEADGSLNAFTAVIADTTDLDNDVPVGAVGDVVKLRTYENGMLASYDMWTQLEINTLNSVVANMNLKQGAIGASPEIDPNAATASELQLLRGLLVKLIAIDTELQLKADLTETQPVSLAAVPLPAGAATEVTLEAARVLLNTISGKDFATQTTLEQLRLVAVAISNQLPAMTGPQTSANSLSVTYASDQAPLNVTPTVQAMDIYTTQKAVGVAAVRATVDGLAPVASRIKLILKPSADNSGRIYLGGSGVTTANGMEIIGPDRVEFELDSADYYLISDTAAQVVEILEKY